MKSCKGEDFFRQITKGSVVLIASSLSKSQTNLLSEFYSFSPRKVYLDKSERDSIYKFFRKNRKVLQDKDIKNGCPSLYAEINKSLKSGNLIQSAIFSECVYAQALATQLNLNEFTDYVNNPRWLTSDIFKIIRDLGMQVRYVYKNSENSRLLIQAGGPGGVDSALISKTENNVYSIEFKEPLAKSSEADLSPYGEDGLLVQTPKLAAKWPQFQSMIEEQLSQRLNFFENIGNNINNFSTESITSAITDNYLGKKFADVICTEDTQGVLTMLPSNHIHIWASLQGEIRPSGRNSYSVWTPKRLLEDIRSINGVIHGSTVSIPLIQLDTAGPRGGVGISRYKINSLFFVRSSKVEIDDKHVVFDIKDVLQNRPTITAKMFFDNLSFNDVKNYYFGRN